MAGKWKNVDSEETPLLKSNPETDWLINVIGRRRALALDIELPRQMAEDLFFAIAVRDRFLDRPDDRTETEFDRLVAFIAIETQALSVAATLDRPAFDRLQNALDTDGGANDLIRTRLLVDLEALANWTEVFGITGVSVERLPEVLPQEPNVIGKPRILDVRIALSEQLVPLFAPPDFLIIGNPKDDGASDDGEGVVIVAVIDEGIGVANDRFRLSPTKTRVAHFLDMDANIETLRAVDDHHPKRNGEFASDAPNDLALLFNNFDTFDANTGLEWTKERIDGLLENEPDEVSIYRAMGLIRPGSDARQPHAFRITHGTHVLDTAAGYDWRDDAALAKAEKRPIVAVQLPSRIVADRTDSEMHLALETALDFIRDRADAVSQSITGIKGRRLPLVVNFSFGNYAGPQDGTSAIEGRIDAFLNEWRGGPTRVAPDSGQPACEFVLSGGNSFQAQVFAAVPLGPNIKEASLGWAVEPEDVTSSYVQMWLPAYGIERQRIAVALVPPRGAPEKMQFSAPGGVLEWRTEEGALARIYHRFDAVNRRETVTLCVRGTWNREETVPVCPSGEWKIELRAVDPKEPFEVECRIRRDDPLAYGRREGRQSRFTDPSYKRHDSVTGEIINRMGMDDGPVRRDGTLSTYAGGTGPVVVAGHRDSDGEPAFYSSAGPTANPLRDGPDVSAVSDDGPSRPGILASGTYSGTWVRLNGTSVAAPQVTRMLADRIEDGEGLAQLIDIARTNEALKIHERLSPTPTAARIGAGRLLRYDSPNPVTPSS